MREYLECGPVPYEEDAAQVGEANFRVNATEQCTRYVAQLERLFPGVSFGIKWFPHDFGAYPEVVVYYDSDDPTQVELAYKVEAELPAEWDKV